MATVQYQSTQTATSSTSTLVVTKPVSLALNDLMLAFISGVAVGTITSPAGWTQISQDVTSGTAIRTALFYKLADSTDISASDFTFTSANTPTTSFFRGNISRFTKTSTLTPFDQLASVVSSNSYGTAGITPTKAMSTFAMFVMGYETSIGNNTMSGYSITNDNPTWTEAYDGASLNGSSSFLTAMAYASRPTMNASGVSSVTSQRTTTGSVVYLVNIAPPEIDTLSMASTAIRQESIRYVSQTTLSLTSALIDPVVSSIASVWRNATKHIATWRNQDKS